MLAQLFSDPQIAAEFSDEQFTRYALTVEAALAKVQADLGIIPADAAQAIIAGAASLKVDSEQLRNATEKDGIPIIDLVRQLRAHVGGEAASYVHWGATTQDIMDTALVLQIRSSLSHIESRLHNLTLNLARLADQHRNTLMAGRTHSQQALPLPFGFKVAGWLAPLLRDRQRLTEIKPRLLVIELGGGVGTLAALGQSGIRVQHALAAELDLAVPLMPWHTQRDSLVELAGWLSLVTGSLGKMAQDIILMAQTEVGELRESADSSRGGSSTMPQKSNPIVSELIIAAARTNATLLSAMHQALVQEHERATSAWQIEWLNFPQMVLLTAAALKKAQFLSVNLVVDSARMRDNVRASNGLMLAEALDLALAPFLGRAEAKKLISAACQRAIQDNLHLVDVVHSQVDAPLNWEALKDESAYFGSANAFIDRVLQEVEKR
ncbi:MAG: 3-carboxy-cis,cis-muconate cycloisomerase [Chloroflexota bacterium]